MANLFTDIIQLKSQRKYLK